jgi:hypothetical protein
LTSSEGIMAPNAQGAISGTMTGGASTASPNVAGHRGN